jgi:hypothetical protein
MITVDQFIILVKILFILTILNSTDSVPNYMIKWPI